MTQPIEKSSTSDQSTPLVVLCLDTRVYNALRRAGIDTVEEVISLTDAELLGIRQIGTQALEQIKTKLVNYLGQASRPQGLEVPGEESSVNKVSIDVLELSHRARRRLQWAGIETVAQLVDLSEKQILSVPRFSEDDAAEVRERLADYFDRQLTSREPDRPEEPPPPAIRVVDMSLIDVLGLSTRVHNALKRVDIDAIDQLVELSEEQILNVPNIGEKGAAEVKQKLSDYLDQHPEALIEEEQLEPSAPPLIAFECLERLSDAPLDKISVDRLLLPPLEAGYLARYGITSIGELARWPADLLPEDSLFAVRLTRYLDWLVEQDEDVWDAEMSGERISPIHRILLSETTLDGLIDAWLDFLTPREREILRRRIGCDGPRMTLAEIGERMDLSRERIRQLEVRALQKLSSEAAQKTVDHLIRCLVQAFADAGGLMTEEEVHEFLVDLVAVELIDVTWASQLLLTAGSMFEELGADRVWGLVDFPLELVPQVNQSFTSLVKDAGGLIPRDELRARFAESSFHQEYGLMCEDVFLEACLRTHPTIECVEGMCVERRGRREPSVSTEAAQEAKKKTAPSPQATTETGSRSKPAASEASKPRLVIDLEDVEPLSKPPGTLDEWERYLRPKVGQVELLGEIALTDQERAQLGKVIGLRVRALGHGRAVRTLRSKYPCALAVYLVAQGVYGYKGGVYWTDVVEVTGFKRSRSSEIGQAFEDILEALDLPLFYDLRAESFRYVSLILAHGGIPNYCLPDFFDNMLQPSVVRAEYLDMSAAELIAEWLWRSSVVQRTDKPVIYFLKYGGRVAEDFVDRCREMAFTYVDSGVMPSPEEVGLPQRVVAAYDEWIAEQGTDQLVQDKGDRWRLRKPRVLVDPWGEWVLVELPPQQVPATEIYTDIEWQVTADEETNRVPVHVRRRGFDRKTEAEDLPLTQPAEKIEVSLLVDGESKRTWRFQGIDEEHSLLVFDPERGTLLSWTRSLPAGPLGLLYPADWQLRVEGDGRLIEELPRLPWGWSTFRGETWDLTQATTLILSREGEEAQEIPLRPSETARQPSLEGGQPFSLGDTEEKAPVYVGAPPRVRVPLTGRQTVSEELSRWRLRVRNKWLATPERDVTKQLAELESKLTVTDQYVELPLTLPSLLGETPYGNYEIRLRGPLGRDAAFTLRMIPHFVLCGHEELYLPTAEEGQQPARLLAETLPKDRIECLGEDVECEVQVTERGAATWQHQIDVGPDVTDLELTVIHPHPSGEAVRIPIRVPIRRLRWALVDEETRARRGAWTGRTIKRPIDAILQQQAPFLFVRLPLQETGEVQLGLRLLNLEGDERQATNRVSFSHSRPLYRFDLGAFLDTIRASRSPVLRFELVIWSLPGWNKPFRIPILSLTQTLLVEDAQLSFRTVDGRVIFDLTWDEPAPLRNRRVRFWPLWRPWDPVFEQGIPDDAEGAHSFEVNPEKLLSGKYRLEFLVVDPWTSGSDIPQRPPRGTPSTADVEMIAPERQLEILDGRIRERGRAFEILLERAAIYQDIGAVEKAAPDRQWCYEHLDDGTVRQALALADLAREAGDDVLTRSLQLKLFAARRIERLLAKREVGEVSTDLFESYLDQMPKSKMLPVATCRQLLSVEDETVRLDAVQQLIHRQNPAGPQTVIRWVDEAEMSDADAVALLKLRPSFSIEHLRGQADSPVVRRLLEALPKTIQTTVRVIRVGDWVNSTLGWGNIYRIEHISSGAEVDWCAGIHSSYRLFVVLRPEGCPERVVIDLASSSAEFVEPGMAFVCTECEAFTTQNLDLLSRHFREAHPPQTKKEARDRSDKYCKFHPQREIPIPLGFIRFSSQGPFDCKL